MATNTKLLQAKNLAKGHYEVTKGETTARANPPGHQNIQRKLLNLLRCVKRVQNDWWNYEGAFLDLAGTFTNPKDDAKARDQLIQESEAHYDWFAGIQAAVLKIMEQEEAEQARVIKPEKEQVDECKIILYEEVLANGPSVALQGDNTTKHAMSGHFDCSTAPHNPVEMSVPTNKNPDTLAMVQADMVLFPTFPQPELVIATRSGISEENAFSPMDLSSPLLPSSRDTHVSMAPLLNSSSMAISTSDYKEDHGPSTIMFLNRFPILSSSEEIHGTCTTLGLAPSCYSPALSDPVDMWEDEEDFLDLWGSTPHSDTGEMFDKLEEEGAALRQDLEELHEDLGRLMEKHGVAGEVFDEKYELRKPVAKSAEAEWKYSAGFTTLDMSPCSSSHKVTTPSDLAIFMTKTCMPTSSPLEVKTTMGIMTLAPPIPRHLAGLPWESHTTDPLAP